MILSTWAGVQYLCRTVGAVCVKEDDNDAKVDERTARRGVPCQRLHHTTCTMLAQWQARRWKEGGGSAACGATHVRHTCDTCARAHTHTHTPTHTHTRALRRTQAQFEAPFDPARHVIDVVERGEPARAVPANQDLQREGEREREGANERERERERKREGGRGKGGVRERGREGERQRGREAERQRRRGRGRDIDIDRDRGGAQRASRRLLDLVGIHHTHAYLVRCARGEAHTTAIVIAPPLHELQKHGATE